jgi:DNA adenine methylase
MKMIYSPLRYPGGKSKLTAYVLETRRLNKLEGGTYAEPFAGGAAIAFYLLINQHVKNIYINDLDESIYCFWHSVLNETDLFCSLIDSTNVSIEEWHKQRAVYLSKTSSMLERGFATFFLNRTNRSGIIKGGVVGGLSQTGNYKLDCRFNKERLKKLVQLIGAKRDNVTLTNLDAVDFIEKILPFLGDKTLINIDPPYYVKGKGLYSNFFEERDHYRLYEAVTNIKQPWIVTYDDIPEIVDLYSKYNPLSFGLTYVAQVKRKGSEVIVLKPTMITCPHPPDISFKQLQKMF